MDPTRPPPDASDRNVQVVQSTLHAASYTSAEAQARERAQVFTPAWHLLAHASQLANAGTVLETQAAGVPLLLVNDAGRLHALHNVCRHRAGPLARVDDGRRPRLRCRYHGWTYGLDGQLHQAPDWPPCAGFDPAAIHLPQARLAVWQDLLFVAVGDAPQPPPATLFDDLGAYLRGRHLAAFRFHASVGYDIACNWKVYVDNYLEGYHIPHIHPALNRMLDYRSYATDCGHWHSRQHSPLDAGDGPWGRGEALYVYLWPNAMLNLLPDRLQVNRVLPLAPDRCRVEFDYFYPAGTATDIAARHAADHALSDLVQQEDVAICEAVQRGLASGSWAAGPLNPRREQGVAHFHALLRRAGAD